jgi:hypothetical protein
MARLTAIPAPVSFLGMGDPIFTILKSPFPTLTPQDDGTPFQGVEELESSATGLLFKFF